MKHPYKGLPDYCFWPKAMASVAPWQVNPVTSSKLIKKGELVSTMGSCFAQHIARHIASVGLDYFVPEIPPLGMDELEAKRKNYNVFSARYGNVYTVRQAIQLLEMAFDRFSPVESIWKKGDRYVDAFRPQIDPDGFQTEREVQLSREMHLAHVKKIFLQSDWLVFTLGLTEAWRSKIDGAIYPLAPGVSGGEFDDKRHEFVNFSVDEIRADLSRFIALATEVNPKIKFLLTVSPVPLMATYEKRHVWVSTTCSKAALRVAVDEAEQKFENVSYFPSYEIITSPAAGNSYYADDFRDVIETGVNHVMRIFSDTFLNTPSLTSATANPVRTIELKNDVICDEEVLGHTDSVDK